MTQTERILELLRERGPYGITDVDVWTAEIRIRRLSARIWDLRQEGHDIRSETYETPNGARVARYVLIDRQPVTEGDQLQWTA